MGYKILKVVLMSVCVFFIISSVILTCFLVVGSVGVFNYEKEESVKYLSWIPVTADVVDVDVDYKRKRSYNGTKRYYKNVDIEYSYVYDDVHYDDMEYDVKEVEVLDDTHIRIYINPAQPNESTLLLKTPEYYTTAVYVKESLPIALMPLALNFFFIPALIKVSKYSV